MLRLHAVKPVELYLIRIGRGIIGIYALLCNQEEHAKPVGRGASR